MKASEQTRWYSGKHTPLLLLRGHFAHDWLLPFAALAAFVIPLIV
jgi:hypothetical protein